MTQKSVLRVEGLTKIFPGVIANSDISFNLGEEEIISIIGENGAGKSTFCKMLTGVYKPDGGSIYINEKEVKFNTPRESVAAGIAMVYQERNLVKMMTGAQNIVFGHEPVKNKLFVDEKETYRAAYELREKMGLDIPLDVPIEKLGVGTQQLIEIMRAFYLNPKILILDEPTASLGKGEIEPFLNLVKQIKKTMHISVIFISHKIEEVFAISDKIAVFTDGKCVLVDEAKNLTEEQCITAMIRGNTLKPIEINSKPFEQREEMLKVESAVYDGKQHDIKFEVRHGETVGFYGLVGSGRTECAEMIYGLRKASNRNIQFNNESITKQLSPRDMINRGMVMTAEKRANAIFRSFSLVDNTCNLFLDNKVKKGVGFYDFKAAKNLTDTVLKKNNVKYSNANQAIADLSGGNIQKIIIGRSLEVNNISCLILDEPTTGMDVGAKNEIYRHVRELVEKDNMGILFISSELDELLSVCDRIYVFYEGNVVGHVDRTQFNRETILGMAVRGH